MDLSGSSEFAQTVEAIATLLQTGALSWRLRANGFVEARIDEQQLEKAEVKPDLAILRREVTPLLTSALTETPIDWYLPINPQTDDRTEIDARRAIVDKRFVTSALKERYLIRKTAKGDAFNHLRWDICVKRHDFAEGSLRPLCFATLEFVAARAVSGSVPFFARFWPGSITDEEQSTLMFDCHADDLEVLIRDLSTIRDNLRRLQDETAKG